MRATRLLAVFLCGCLIVASMPVNTYAAALTQISEAQTNLPTEETSENSEIEVIEETITDGIEEITTEPEDEECTEQNGTEEAAEETSVACTETEESVTETVSIEEDILESISSEETIFVDTPGEETILLSVNEDGSVMLNESNFPDEAFRSYIGESIDMNSDDMLSKEEIAAVTEIDLSTADLDVKVASLEGICYFTNIQTLNCSYQQLEELNLEGLVNLEWLNCSYNELTQLDLEEFANLKWLNCDSTELTELNISDNTKLEHLSLNNSNLTELDIESNPLLTYLDCSNNGLSKLNISSNLLLEFLWCGNTGLTELDVTNQSALKNLNCTMNNLTELSLSNNALLEELNCSYNKLKNLDVRDHLALKTLMCSENDLEELKVSGTSALDLINCSFNELTELDIRSCPALRVLYCYYNKITELDVKNNLALTELGCSGNRIKELDLKNNLSLNHLICFNDELTKLDIRGNDNEMSCFSVVPSNADLTVYCTVDTWIENYCKTNNIKYSTEEPAQEEQPGGEDIESVNLADAVIICQNTYLKVKKNNAAQEPKISSVKLGEKTLKKNTDYTVSYERDGQSVAKLTTCGVYQMTLTGKGNYTGSQTMDITVTDRKLLSSVTVKVNKMPYTGEAITSGVIRSVKYGNKTLVEGKDYTVSYVDNTNSGKGMVLLTAIDSSDYAGSKAVSFEITGRKLNDSKKVKVRGVVNLDYDNINEMEQNPESVIVTYKVSKNETVILTEGTDYTISYENNKKAGTAKIVFTGKGFYNGILKKTFKINKTELNKLTLDGTEISVMYEKAGVKPDVNLTHNGVKLVNGVDYKLTYSNNKKISTDRKKARITIEGKGNYKESLSKEFTINAKAITDDAITISAADVKFNIKKNKYTTNVKVSDHGVVLQKGTDYKITFVKTPITELPSGGMEDSFVVEGIGNYSGEISQTFRIVKNLINDSNIQVKKIPNQVYLGENVVLTKDDIILTNTKTKEQLKPEEFEIINHSNNHKVGTAKVTIKGVGEYGGTRTIKFKIVKAK